MTAPYIPTTDGHVHEYDRLEYWRYMFAKDILASYSSHNGVTCNSDSIRQRAVYAVNQADALLKELNKEKV